MPVAVSATHVDNSIIESAFITAEHDICFALFTMYSSLESSTILLNPFIVFLMFLSGVFIATLFKVAVIPSFCATMLSARIHCSNTLSANLNALPLFLANDAYSSLKSSQNI